VGDPVKDPRYRLGRGVVKWIEANCVYGEGDKFGQKVKLESFQKLFVLQLYEVKPNGKRRYRRALLEVPKGNGKTPLSAWIGAYELTHQASAVIPVAAASYDQAELLFGDLRNCVSEGPLIEHLEPFEAEIQVRGGPGRAYKVAAVAGTNDGQRPSCFLADEIHEWLGNKARVHIVIANGLSKRTESLNLNTTTPGADLESMAGKMHEHGLRVNAGEVRDDEFLFVWYGCPEGRYDLTDPDQLRQAIRDANPAADAFLNVEDVAGRHDQIPSYEFARYHLGQWTSVWETWLPEGAWDALARPDLQIPDGAEVFLGFDGSFNNDSTALVVVTNGDVPHIDVAACWERPERAPEGWAVPIIDVEEEIRLACRRWKVKEIACDPYRWARTLQALDAERLPIMEFNQNPSTMTPATQRFYEAVVNGGLTHSGDPRLARHISNTVVKVDARGSRLAKESKASMRKIDLAIASVMAFDRASQVTPPPPDYTQLIAFGGERDPRPQFEPDPEPTAQPTRGVSWVHDLAGKM
jgi:phage terminase large subunit-like protein